MKKRATIKRSRRQDPHTALVNAVLNYLEYFPRQIRVWKQHRGKFKVQDEYGIRWIEFNVPGAADITGIWKAYGGKRIEIECKTGAAKQTKDQIAFQKMIEDMGGIYIIARSVDDVKHLVKMQFGGR